MKLIMGSDDFGYNEVFNMGLKKVFQHHTVSNVALMTDTPGNIDAFRFLREHPDVSVTWHQHFRGRPVVDPSKVPSLLNKKGGFRYREVWDKDTFDMVAINRKFEGVVYEEALMELRAEMELCAKYMGRVPDFGGGRGNNAVADATRQVCEEFGIKNARAMKETAVPITHIPQPQDPCYLNRISEDSYTRNCCYDPMAYLEEDKQGVLQHECSQITWHAGFFDDDFFMDGSYFYNGDQKLFEPSPLRDCYMLCSDSLKAWIKKNKVELVSMVDAAYGTKKFQNYLRSIDSELWIGNILKGEEA